MRKLLTLICIVLLIVLGLYVHPGDVTVLTIMGVLLILLYILLYPVIVKQEQDYNEKRNKYKKG